MFHILLEELVDDTEGILVGGRIEIKSAAKKMAGGVGQEELIGGGGVTAYVEEDAADAVGCLDDGLIDGAGFGGMFEGHFESVVAELVKLVGAYSLIADIDTGVKAGEIDIDPIGIFGYGIEKTAVAYDPGVDGIFECIGEPGLVEGLVLVGGEIYLKITASFWGVDAITGKEEGEGQEQGRKAGKGGMRHFCVRICDGVR